MTLIKRYETAIAQADIIDDPMQRQILDVMQELSNAIQKRSHSWFPWQRKKQAIGLYLYGPVGVGKTYLMDLFYEEIKGVGKARFHFHQFMQQIDQQLRRLQGQKDPLLRIAAELAKKITVLCFDEFLVNDVAHAMILAELLQALFAQGIVLIATSNTAPDELYRNGVQRDRFLPAIALIKTHCEVVRLNEKKDYRLGREPNFIAYLYPLDSNTDEKMNEQFAQMTEKTHSDGAITVQNRAVPFIKWGERVIWFEFKVICNLPRSQLDYLEISERFDTIFVSNIPQLTANDTIHAILLINFVDVMYDQGIKLILSAAVELEHLYLEGEMSQSFKRTLSRLQEMQSLDYIKRHSRRLINSF